MAEIRHYIVYDLTLRRFMVTVFESWIDNKNIELISCYDSAKIAIEETRKKNLGF